MKRHRLDPFSLVFGATFAVLSSLFLFSSTFDVQDLHLKWVWPLPLIVLGALIIALSVREGRPSRAVPEPPAPPELEDTPDE